MPPIICARGLCFSSSAHNQKIDILRDVNLSIERKQTLVVYGRSGSGKSTLLSLIAGLQTPTSGELEVLGLPFHSLSDEQRTAARRGQIGFVYQDFQLLPNLNAWENVVFPLRLLNRAVDKATVHQWFEKFGLVDRIKHYPFELSGGEQQRVAIMRALLFEPAIVLADEPTGNLDRQNALGFIDILLSVAVEHGAAVVVVTHDQNMIEAGNDRLELR